MVVGFLAVVMAPVLSHPIIQITVIGKEVVAGESVTWESKMMKREEGQEFKCCRHLGVIISYLLEENPGRYLFRRVDLFVTVHLKGTVKLGNIEMVILREIKSLHLLPAMA